MVKFFIFFVHRLFNKLLQFIGPDLHDLLMLVGLLSHRYQNLINRKSPLNNNNNNILLL